MSTFSYKEAFARNIGWVTEEEQEKLRNTRVAIAGMGGVGGAHAVTLARLGVGKFIIADLDVFDWPNFNRQQGAFVSTVDKPKVEVMAAQLRDINPDVELTILSSGVTEENLNEFLQDVDVYVDSLDIFALDIRRAVFARCRELGIPAITAAPMGMGTAVLVFTKDSMSFEDYFAFGDRSFEDRLIKFIVGVSPSMQQRHYLAVKTTLNLRERKAPSTIMGIDLAAGVLCTNVLKLVLNRGEVITAPSGLHFDAYRNTLLKTWRPFGNRNPIQLLMYSIVRNMIAKAMKEAKK